MARKREVLPPTTPLLCFLDHPVYVYLLKTNTSLLSFHYSFPCAAGQLRDGHSQSRDSHCGGGTRKLFVPGRRHGNAGDADDTRIPRVSEQSTCRCRPVQTAAIQRLV